MGVSVDRHEMRQEAILSGRIHLPAGKMLGFNPAGEVP